MKFQLKIFALLEETFFCTYVGNCDCLCKCCKTQGIPKKCAYSPIKEVKLNSTHEELRITESIECANYTKQLIECRSECVSGRYI